MHQDQMGRLRSIYLKDVASEHRPFVSDIYPGFLLKLMVACKEPPTFLTSECACIRQTK